jgi:hypothetical protein
LGGFIVSVPAQGKAYPKLPLIIAGTFWWLKTTRCSKAKEGRSDEASLFET